MRWLSRQGPFINDVFKNGGSVTRELGKGMVGKGDGIYETPSDYDPLTVNMGQLTVYRFNIRCQCNENLLREEIDGYQRCGQFLPYENQGWPSFMGAFGDSKFNMDTIFHKYVHKP